MDTQDYCTQDTSLAGRHRSHFIRSCSGRAIRLHTFDKPLADVHGRQMLGLLQVLEDPNRPFYFSPLQCFQQLHLPGGQGNLQELDA
jgi:hypothetical protein